MRRVAQIFAVKSVSYKMTPSLVFLVYFVAMFRCILSGDTRDVDVLSRYNLVSNTGEFLNTRPPSLNDSYQEPVNVEVSMRIREIRPIDSKNMDFNVILTLRTSWNDPRLTARDPTSWQWKNDRRKYVVFKDTSKIWTPDISFPNGKKSYQLENVFDNGLFVGLYPDGSLFAVKTLFVSFACPMNLKRFPFDTQACVINLASYSETTDNVQLMWKENGVQMAKTLSLPKFNMEKYTTMYRTSKTSTGEYSSISVSITFSRQFYTYLVEYYLPAVFVVLISWLPFWLGRVLILRIYVAFGTAIFLCWHSTVAKATEVTVSYATLLDFWRGMNLVFVFMAAFESIFIAYMIKSNKNFIKRTCKEDNEKFQMLARGNNCPLKKKYLEVVDEKTDLDLEAMKIQANFKICFINVQKEVEIIDTVAKLFFPSAYSIFLFFYWLKC